MVGERRWEAAMRALAFGLVIALGAPGGQAAAVDLLGGTRIQPSLQTQRNLQAGQRQAVENRLQRQLYQAEQRIIREIDRQATRPVEPPPVPEFVPSCRGSISGTANVPLRCR
jgi:hypothetical protein